MMMTNIVTLFLILCISISVTSFLDSDFLISAEPKYILQYNNFHNEEPFQKLNSTLSPFTNTQCPYQNCLVTNNENLLGNIKLFDVIVFQGQNLSGKPPPKERSPRQKYVFANIQPAQNFPICTTKYDNFFNWTWTYKLDSNIPTPYISIRNMKGDIIGPSRKMFWNSLEDMPPIKKRLKKKLSKKTKAGAWLVSDCNPINNRQIYVKNVQNALKKYGLKIDVYGYCNNNSLPIKGFAKFRKTLAKDYYFYFALENSVAPDYVTEKLLIPLQNYAVPIVLGGADYSRFMIPGTYLNAQNLTPDELAKEMNEIIKNNTRYFDMHKWRYYYIYGSSRDSLDSDDRCKLCAMLNDNDIMRTITIVRDFLNWWNKDKICDTRLIAEQFKPLLKPLTRNLFKRIFSKLRNEMLFKLANRKNQT